MKIKNASFLIVATVTLVTLGYVILKPSEYEFEMKKAYAIKESNLQITSFDGYTEPPIPNSEEDKKTLLGVDFNKNGLRDDVEIWINRTQSDSGTRNALRQLHLVFQKTMVVKEDFTSKKIDTLKANQYFQEVTDAGECLDSYYSTLNLYFDSYLKFKNIVQLSNGDRRKQYKQAEDQQSVATKIVGGLSDKEKRIQYCKINIENSHE